MKIKKKRPIGLNMKIVTDAFQKHPLHFLDPQ